MPTADRRTDEPVRVWEGPWGRHCDHRATVYGHKGQEGAVELPEVSASVGSMGARDRPSMVTIASSQPGPQGIPQRMLGGGGSHGSQ